MPNALKQNQRGSSNLGLAEVQPPQLIRRGCFARAAILRPNLSQAYDAPTSKFPLPNAIPISEQGLNRKSAGHN